MQNTFNQVGMRLLESLLKYQTPEDGWSHEWVASPNPDAPQRMFTSQDEDFVTWTGDFREDFPVLCLWSHEPFGGYSSVWFWDESGRVICFPETSPWERIGHSFDTYGIPTVYSSPESAASVLCTGEELPGT